jgi:signal transduction histidine kinase
MVDSQTFQDSLLHLRTLIERLFSQVDEAALGDLLKARSILECLSTLPSPLDEHARLATLYAVSRTLGSSLDLEEALNQVMDAVIQLTGADRGFLMLYQQQSGELDLVAARNLEQRDLEKDEMQVSKTIIRQALQCGEGILTSNAQTDDRFSDTASIARYALRSILCVPLRLHGDIIGVIYVDNKAKTGLFNKGDLETLETLAVQAATAIENARLYTQTDAALAQRVAELETLQKIDRELNTDLDFERVLDLTLNWAIRVTDAEDGWIAIRSEESPMMHIVTGLGRGTSLRSDQIGDPTFFHPLLQLHPLESRECLAQLIVPIRREEETIAVIGVHRFGDPFTDTARIFLERLAEHAAIAIENTRLYRSVQAANLAKSHFISLVAHELRIPMTAICGYADLLSQGAAGSVNEQQEAYLKIIRRNVDRMDLLVTDLSDISRIETGQLEIESNPVPVEEVIRETVAELLPQFENKQQTLSLEIPKDIPDINADPARLVQILTNLLSNANKYTPTGGNITICARVDGKDVRVMVTDDGIGIRHEDQTDLFSQFFRSEDPIVREQQGWGMGLHVAYRLVRLMGGEINFESEYGKGSHFWFSLPHA